MAIHLVKANWNKDQLRIAIPKNLVEQLEWKGVKFVMLKAHGSEYFTVRRFINGESLEGDRAPNKA